VRENCTFVADAKAWVDMVFGAPAPLVAEEDREFISGAGAHLPEGDLTPESWGAWTSALKTATGRKGRSLFMPLRKALTGAEHGPEMSAILPLIGREKVLQRLS
jgi:glutamyl-tRNA synthetase